MWLFIKDHYSKQIKERNTAQGGVHWLTDEDLYRLPEDFTFGQAFEEHPKEYPLLIPCIALMNPASSELAVIGGKLEHIVLPDFRRPIFSVKELTDTLFEGFVKSHAIPHKVIRKEVIPAGLVFEAPLRLVIGVLFSLRRPWENAKTRWAGKEDLQQYNPRFPWDTVMSQFDRLQYDR